MWKELQDGKPRLRILLDISALQAWFRKQDFKDRRLKYALNDTKLKLVSMQQTGYQKLPSALKTGQNIIRKRTNWILGKTSIHAFRWIQETPQAPDRFWLLDQNFLDLTRFFPFVCLFYFILFFLENLANHMLMRPIPASNLQPKILDPPLQYPMMEERGVCFMRQ